MKPPEPAALPEGFETPPRVGPREFEGFPVQARQGEGRRPSGCAGGRMRSLLGRNDG